MGRRPYIDQYIIRDDLHANATYKDGYSQHCPNYEPVGMDGRNDWFRWSCRECDKTFISPRSEKRQKYYDCTECGASHFVYKGFFDIDRSPTVPLRPDEVTVDLYHAVTEESKYGSRSEFYGGLDYIREKIDSDYFDIERVWLVTDECEVLAQEGDVSSESLMSATIQ